VTRKAVILTSGGLDSTTVLALAKAAGHELHAISFDYGQKHRFELESAAVVARAMGVKKHITSRIDLLQLGGSALTGGIEVPKSNSVEGISREIPATYVPARNTIFLSLALGWAEIIGATDIFIGVNAMDYSGYPDCRPEYIRAFEKLANLATKSGVEAAERGGKSLRIHAPLVQMTKAEIIRKGIELEIDYSLTHSCYDPSEDRVACGHCDACLLRLRGFHANGLDDPVKYQS
jgi:7-cyano-7-deazaguanine synthase